MGCEWQRTCWGALATLGYGKALRGYNSSSGAVRVYGTNGPIGWHSEALHAGPSVIVGRKGAYRGIRYAPEPFFVIDTAFYLKPKVQFDVRWAYYQLLTQDINGMDSGSAIPSTSREEFNKLPVYLPPIESQRNIAATLAALDDKIALNRETNVLLEAIAQVIFKSWFVDFHPVRAKMEGREPEGMDAETAVLFPSEFVDSELGLIPKGWSVTRIGNILELAYGKALKATDRIPGPVPVYGSGGITGFHSTHRTEGPSIIVGRKGTVGSLYWEDRAFFPIDTVFFVKPKGTPLTYCYYTLQALSLDRMNTDAAVPGLNRENVYRLLIPQPPDSLMDIFDSYVSPLRDTIFAKSCETDDLNELRDTLLPKLISG